MEQLLIKFLLSLLVLVVDFLGNVFQGDLIEIEIILSFFSIVKLDRLFLDLAFWLDNEAVGFLVGDLFAGGIVFICFLVFLFIFYTPPSAIFPLPQSSLIFFLFFF